MSATSVSRSQSVGHFSKQDEHGHQMHAIHFYWDEAFLIDTLSQQVGEALGAGGAAMVIATRSHHNELERRLKERGLDAIGATKQGRYVAWDAAETLARFMLDGQPDESRFREVVGGAILQTALAAGSEHAPVIAFGEMVALMWEQGMSQAALRLEHFWSDLIRTHSFTLHCAYPMSAFRGRDDSGLFRMVCEQHSRVISAAGQAEPFNEDNYHRTLALMQQQTQELETERALRQSEQGFRLLVESVQDYAIFMLDHEGHVCSWNDGARRQHTLR